VLEAEPQSIHARSKGALPLWGGRDRPRWDLGAYRSLSTSSGVQV
jgi:hypothetical protein